MQVDEYQIVDVVVHRNGTTSGPITRRAFSGKVWCTWVNGNKAVITQPFWEEDLEPATYQQNNYATYASVNHTH